MANNLDDAAIQAIVDCCARASRSDGARNVA
jgi:hypothetical protein